MKKLTVLLASLSLVLSACASSVPNQARTTTLPENFQTTNVVQAKVIQRLEERIFEAKLPSGEVSLVRVPSNLQLSEELQAMPIKAGFQTKLVWFVAVPVAVGVTGLWFWLTTPHAS